MDSIDLHAVARGIPLLILLQKPFVIIGICVLVESSRKAKVRQLQVPILVNQDVVWFDITGSKIRTRWFMASTECLPMYVAEVVNSLDRKNAFCHVESCDIFREDVVLHQHSHEITTRKELHDEIQVVRVLKRIEKLNDPRRRRFCKKVSLRANMSKLQCSGSTKPGNAGERMSYLVSFQHLSFLEGLHGIHFAGVYLLYQTNLEKEDQRMQKPTRHLLYLSKCALADHLHRTEIGETDLGSSESQMLGLESPVLADFALLGFARDDILTDFLFQLDTPASAESLVSGRFRVEDETGIPPVSLDGRIDRKLVVGLKLELGSCRTRNGIRRELLCTPFEVDIVLSSGSTRGTRDRGRGALQSERCSRSEAVGTARCLDGGSLADVHVDGQGTTRGQGRKVEKNGGCMSTNVKPTLVSIKRTGKGLDKTNYSSTRPPHYWIIRMQRLSTQGNGESR